MAVLDGANASLINADASNKAGIGEQGGRVRMIYDSYELSGDLALSDIIRMGGKLPQGARVLDVILNHSSLGAGTLNVGWGDGLGGLEAADADGFLAGTDASVEELYKMSNEDSAVPGYLKKFAEEVQVQIEVATDTSATSGTIELTVLYVVE